MYLSTKTYGHETGLSCAFRQPKATHSHCSLIHGYALAFKFKFGATELDDKNWAVDFGDLGLLKDWLKDNFDHKTAVDNTDPELDTFRHLDKIGLIDLVIMDGVGCEKFAYYAWKAADEIIQEKTNGRCYCISCEVKEHGANSAIYVREASES